MSDDLTIEDLAEQRAALDAELSRRTTLTQQEARIDQMCLAYLLAEGREQGDDWIEPMGVLGAYPRGWQTSHDGAAWRAVVPGATQAPGGDQWQETTEEPVPYWEPGDYTQGDLVQDAGRTWRALSDLTDGPRPSSFPGGWTPTDG